MEEIYEEEPDCLPFVSVSVREHVSLMPSYMGDIGNAIYQHLNKRLLNYSSKLGGILVSYSRPALLKHYGLLMADLPQIHVDIQYNATVLQTPLHSTILATVNRVGEDFVTCTWAKCMNIVIPYTEMEGSVMLSEGDPVLVNITRVSIENDEYVLFGRLLLTNAMRQSNSEEGRGSKANDDEKEVLSKEKKKKRKRKHSELATEAEEDIETSRFSTMEEIPGSDDQDSQTCHKVCNSILSPKKKKRKKKDSLEGPPSMEHSSKKKRRTKH
ncbi:PREDICTED: DNA-directed RNA polymerase I subunit RPA43-like [Amphimedon queenslandica]|uniref:RPA43 OB domain-containing protein n=1 Tax=Amphimedon queenslandica TaxID=400682 RepID=A0A1X7TT98_AMPQE|nr:PREDICTED: DNA-directed RNA polymerase I subunit RPA43-like [Amphimedon queenslandica]|eukprot:XP_011406879.1 PREDICTED: DNA-directed RNA polymerase I subunit RPA43-like [Amphimedon queenslandica]